MQVKLSPDGRKESGYRLHVVDIVSRFVDTNKKIFHGVEVGIKCGFTSRALLEKFPNLFLYMVDTWEPTPLDHPSIAIWIWVMPIQAFQSIPTVWPLSG